MQFQDLGGSLILIAILLVSLSVHEFAHAYVANIFGDPTAKHLGRQTINPIAHWDPLGTSLLVGLILLRGLGLPVPVFGWGKPVPVNEDNFDNPRIQGLQVAIAGPLSNFFLAIIFSYLAGVMATNAVIADILVTAVYLNIFLMFFNLIPVPPLDGSRILRLFISDDLYHSLSVNPIFFIMVIFIIFSFVMSYIVNLSLALSQRLLAIF